MKHFALSVYPEKASLTEIEEYFQRAKEISPKRVFSCLLSAGNDKERILKEYRELCDLAHKYGMKIILDVSGDVFKRYQIPLDDLSFFVDMHTDGIRLDGGFTAKEIADLTKNKEGLKIEINGSSPFLVEEMAKYEPDFSNLQASHNFYPQEYTGLSQDYFDHCNEVFEVYNVPVGAFITTQKEGAFGPWPISEGLPTLEAFRTMPMDTQAKYLIEEPLIDEILISNSYPTDEELASLAKLPFDKTVLKLIPEMEIPAELKEKLNEEVMIRPDRSEYVLRFYPRTGLSVPAANTRDIEPGDVLILNENYPHYTGEMQIALEEMENDGRKNVIGHIPAEEFELLGMLTGEKPVVFEIQEED